MSGTYHFHPYFAVRFGLTARVSYSVSVHNIRASSDGGGTPGYGRRVARQMSTPTRADKLPRPTPRASHSAAFRVTGSAEQQDGHIDQLGDGQGAGQDGHTDEQLDMPAVAMPLQTRADPSRGNR